MPKKRKQDYVGAPIGNKNAEKWTLETSTLFFENALSLCEEKEEGGDYPKYDFIGEIASEMGEHKAIFVELEEKFPELSPLRTRLVSRLEANCYRNTKRGKIREAVGIVNLKSNHGWTDRRDIGIGQSDSRQPIEVVITKQ